MHKRTSRDGNQTKRGPEPNPFNHAELAERAKEAKHDKPQNHQAGDQRRTALKNCCKILLKKRNHRKSPKPEINTTLILVAFSGLGDRGKNRIFPTESTLKPMVYAVKPSGSGRPFARQHAVIVLASKHAIVIGPTPPGTGVIAPATAAQLS